MATVRVVVDRYDELFCLAYCDPGIGRNSSDPMQIGPPLYCIQRGSGPVFDPRLRLPPG